MTATAEKTNVRERLIETATRLFYEHGYRATGINEIIDAAEIAKASFYHHFKTKEDLLVTCLQKRHDQMMAELRQFIALGDTPAQRIRRVFFWLAESCQCHGTSLGCAFQNMTSEFREAGSKVRELVKWHKDSLRELLHELIAARYLGQGKTEEELGNYAAELYLLVEGALAALPVQCCTWPIETARKIAEDRFKLLE
ncbi:MAG: TetR/AcrR family transcriptional regulator [Planctomycetes bacterium]|jgi:AcrR family transcriptional regulator|nr:TetR/AcrR family transcriptional regulator [Planctomycetota bacterium]MCL4729523.1 TetR/AcrR family transcriptional regulator [Planctomycetota bacterium]